MWDFVSDNYTRVQALLFAFWVLVVILRDEWRYKQSRKRSKSTTEEPPRHPSDVPVVDLVKADNGYWL